MTKRYSVTVTDWQAQALEELAASDEVSVSHIVRAALRDQLPRLLALARFLENPSADPDYARQVIDFMDITERTQGVREFDTHEPGYGPPTASQLQAENEVKWGGARVPTGDEAPPPTAPTPPPSSNTGANSPEGS